MTRRLRQRRAEARLRVRLAADAVLLAAHHASDAPAAFRLAGDTLALEVRQLRALVSALGEQVVALQVQLDSALLRTTAATSEERGPHPSGHPGPDAAGDVGTATTGGVGPDAAVAAAGSAMALVEVEKVAEVLAAMVIVAATGPEAKKQRKAVSSSSSAPDFPDSWPEAATFSEVEFEDPGAEVDDARGRLSSAVTAGAAAAGDKSFSGTVLSWSWKSCIGSIAPDLPDALPQDVKAGLVEHVNQGLLGHRLYFHAPDYAPEYLPTVAVGSAVTFPLQIGVLGRPLTLSVRMRIVER